MAELPVAELYKNLRIWHRLSCHFVDSFPVLHVDLIHVGRPYEMSKPYFVLPSIICLFVVGVCLSRILSSLQSRYATIKLSLTSSLCTIPSSLPSSPLSL